MGLYEDFRAGVDQFIKEAQLDESIHDHFRELVERITAAAAVQTKAAIVAGGEEMVKAASADSQTLELDRLLIKAAQGVETAEDGQGGEDLLGQLGALLTGPDANPELLLALLGIPTGALASKALGGSPVLGGMAGGGLGALSGALLPSLLGGAGSQPSPAAAVPEAEAESTAGGPFAARRLFQELLARMEGQGG